MSKNIKKIQQMMASEFNKSSQVGYTPERVDRKVGDIWTDNDDVKWEQRKGYKIKVNILPSLGIFGHQCSECKKGIESRGVHRDTYNRMGRCYHCQINFEIDLKSKKIGENNNKHFFWVKLQKLLRWQAMDNEAEELIEEMSEQTSPFDMSVANALTNENRKQWKKDAGG
jgi:hypothetical protein